MSEAQSANQDWWTRNTMSYDWNEKIGAEKFSRGWFDDADQRFIFDARLFAHRDRPFDRIIPLDRLAGARVLEIGCGMGLHSELMARAGAELTAIDLSTTSVDATSRRFAFKELKGSILQMDAEKLQFPDDHFDFVWSWGVIHHSSHTGRIIREIHRVLKPGGECRVMVYNLEGMTGYLTMMLKYSWGFWRGRTLDHYLWSDTDGAMARHYSRDMLADIFATFFGDVSVGVLGQEADAVPLPRRLRRLVAGLVSGRRKEDLVRQRGAFLFVTARK